MVNIKSVDIVQDGECSVCKIKFFNGKFTEVMGLNVDYLPEEKRDWFVSVLNSHLTDIVKTAYTQGVKDVQDSFIRVLFMWNKME